MRNIVDPILKTGACLINIGRSTFGKILHIFTPLMDRLLCKDAIFIQMSRQQMQKSSEYFFRRYQLPKIVACVDGTHIKIQKPVNNSSVFFNRKGYYSMNAMVVCNYNMEIIAIDATHPGSCHDSFIWNHSDVREYFSRNINGHFVLADSGYALESFVLTPYRSAEIGTHQHIFNIRHTGARNIIERTIGVLKSPFRCLQRCLNYDPVFCCHIINVCCALHNICRRRNVSITEDFHFDDTEEALDENEPEHSAVLRKGFGGRVQLSAGAFGLAPLAPRLPCPDLGFLPPPLPNLASR
ncbi:putative nuclease HARBI1 [Drosophila ficusphila]|uniref:putative nuclease HARBI1 n=1 Tax=Drosophila ficusphila TaxID=30025 RepID=UPI001C8AB869|nr:putative nuclease HARBI1 [Drosophila ficusphila]